MTDSGSTDNGSADTSTDSGTDQAETTETTESGEEQTPEQKAMVTALKKKFKLVVDGEEIEDEVDWNDEEGLKKKLQMARAAEKRMSEAKAEKKKAMDIVRQWDTDPEGVLERMGARGREIAEKVLLKQIQDELMSPEERELRDLKKYKEMTEAEKKKATEEAEAAKQAELTNHYAQQFQNTIISFLKHLPLQDRLCSRRRR